MRPLSPARARALEIAYARAELRALRDDRPDVRGMVVESLLPAWLATRYLAERKKAGVLMLGAALASFGANLGAPWGYQLVTVLLLALGVATSWGVLVEVRDRRAEATRLREHGPDEYDTAVAAGVRVTTRPWWRNLLGRLLDVAVLVLPVLAAVRAWRDDGWPAGIAAVLAVGCVVAATVCYLRSAREIGRWRADFLAQEGLVLPPLRPEWQVLVG
ncbi:hypothetical protein [Saccharothrix obliqua]|uniref:hypothetical protein n=1 Tax=Saccharothrix obliqua TaxID=2861747 RepID=UPI001C5D3D79|nr:hypothetical protein [Saccharothrix obliqua]MBW4716638.1 hypothetical protein [Saccharothrix obliqua]